MKNKPKFNLPDRLLIDTDSDRFAYARKKILAEERIRDGIGTLSEKTLHKILKHYIEPNAVYHEVDYLGSVADIKNGQGIFEIQTRGYDRLLPKLKKLLPESKVTVVCPLAAEKHLSWIDEKTGESTQPRRSNKRENIFDAFKMLFGIREVITHENLSVRIVYMSVDDLRSLNGYGKDKKHYSTRIDRIPREIFLEIELSSPKDYVSLLPEALPREFVASELSAQIKRTSRYTFYVLKLLEAVGAVRAIGKRGRATLYEREFEKEQS
ncbi:MAG: hypothetical protein IKY62_01245 [Clostridia bacterium]|nr:hypothetical protein [Clostridia bacterium]